jgi:predicted nicotinamide N-methyase
MGSSLVGVPWGSVRAGGRLVAVRSEASAKRATPALRRVAEARLADGVPFTGGSVWESAVVLAHFLASHTCGTPEWWRQKRVLELGAGCGLAGLVAAALGAREVVLTDRVTYMLGANADANFGGEQGC